MINIAILDAAALGTAVAFYKIDKNAGYLFIPYIAWLGLATALNYVVYRDNQQLEESNPQEKPKQPIK